MEDDQEERHVPFDVELEQAALGSCLGDNTFLERISAQLKPSDFYDPLHQRMFSEMQRLQGLGRAVTPLLLFTEMITDKGLLSVGGSRYLKSIAHGAPAIPSAANISRSLKELSGRRALIKIGEDIVSSAVAPPGEVALKDQIQLAEQALYGMAEKAQFGSRMMGFSQAIHLAMLQAEAAQNNGGRIIGLPTGFTEMDSMLGGLQKSDLIIIAGRPGMGKTALATNMAFYAATQDKPILFFSLEMAAQQLSMRILSEQSGIEMWRIRNGQMRSEEWDEYVRTGQRLDSLPLHIDDSGGLTLPQLASRARRAKREHKIEGVVVDYIQLMNATRRGDNRVQEVTEITKGLKALAKELDIPIVALSQLSRGVDARDDKRPVLSDLRESGSIEQDADIVTFVYREEYYVKSREPGPEDPAYGTWQDKMERCHGQADILIEKHRHGATGKIRLGFDGKFTRFRNLE